MPPYLDALVEKAAASGASSDKPVSYNEFKGGLSGASVGLVEFEDGSKAVYKSGPAEELEGEHRNYGEWARFNPDVVPKVYSAHHSGDSYSFLMEYISAPNLYELYGSRPEEGRRGTDKALEELARTYGASRKEETPSNDYLDKIGRKVVQGARRHTEIQDLLGYDALVINGQECVNPLTALRELKGQAERYKAPFSTWTHGDLHARNVHYDGEKDRAYLIDPEKSKYSDYVEDVGRFIATTATNHSRIGPASVGKGTLDYRLDMDPFFSDIVDRAERRFSSFAKEQGDGGFADRIDLSKASMQFVIPAFSDERDLSLASFAEGVKLLDEVYRRALE